MKFWSDDFDMDLLKVFPDAVKILGESADSAVWTVGHTTYDRINNPSVWNTRTHARSAIVWLERPNLRRDDHGWAHINWKVTSEPEVECTWLELLRDQWPHGYEFALILPWKTEQVQFPPPPQQAFERIMYDLRGWRKDPEIAAARQEALMWLSRSSAKFMACLELVKNRERQFQEQSTHVPE